MFLDHRNLANLWTNKFGYIDVLPPNNYRDYGGIIWNRVDCVHYSNILYVWPPKQNVVVDLVLRRHWKAAFSIFCAKRTHWKEQEPISKACRD